MKQYEVVEERDVYAIYTLKEAGTDSSVRICPERGGIAIGCRLAGEELFYLDRETFVDPEANIRGGCPVLFPICGQLEDGRYEWDGAVYPMRNHGVARNRPWEVVDVSESGEASITLRLRSSEGTRKEYPFDFELLFTYALKDGTLHIRQTYRNLSEEAMPMYAGFHPYFKTAAKSLRYDTDATRYLDYNDYKEKPVGSGVIDLTGLKESVALLDPVRRAIAFPGPEGRGRVTMSYGDRFEHVVLWQVDGKPFVCVEPWMALTGELNRGDKLVMVPGGESLETWLAIGYGRE